MRKIRYLRRYLAKLFVGCLMLHLLSGQSLAEPTENERTYEIGVQAYIYAYPMIMMEMTRRASNPIEIPGKVGMNQFVHKRSFPNHKFKRVVRANTDTLFSVVWFDVSLEPQIVSVPATADRYCVLSMHDMWTDVFASPGSRTSGEGAASFGIVGPGWQGELPHGVERLDSPTKMGWIIGRFQTSGPDDFPSVHKLQNGLKVTPLSQWGESEVLHPGHQLRDVSTVVKTALSQRNVPDNKSPPEQVQGMSAAEYFNLFSELLNKHGGHEEDWNMLKLLERLGMYKGEEFLFSRLPEGMQRILENAAREANEIIDDKKSYTGELVNGWQLTYDVIGNYGASYLQRANIARIGLGANVAEDAMYPLSLVDALGRPYDGSHSYVLHFNSDELPPVNAFWSVTMYGPEGYFVENPINRYSIGSGGNLQLNGDGSLDLYIQHHSPSDDKVSNWLPAPPDEFNLLLRLYWPKPEILWGDWVPPEVERIE